MSRKWQTADIFRDFLPSFDMFHRLSLFFVRNGNVWESTITSHMGDRGLLLNKNGQTLLVGCQTRLSSINYISTSREQRNIAQRCGKTLQACQVQMWPIRVKNCPKLFISCKNAQTRGRCLCCFQVCCANFLSLYTQILFFFCILL